MADIPVSNALAASSVPRRETYVLTTSNAALPVPSWAQGGKGIVRITGCGAGASGAVTATASNSGGGGGAGAIASDYPMLIPAGVTTLNCQIGAGGAQVTATAGAVSGNNGSNTSVTAGANSLVLEGGRAANTTDGIASGLRGGYPLPMGMSIAGVGNALGPLQAAPFANGAPSGGSTGGLFGSTPYLSPGATGGNGASGGSGWGAGAASPWGAGGAGRASTPAANTPGVAATGYGSGGSGGQWTSGSVIGGAGAPGILFLEFVEGL